MGEPDEVRVRYANRLAAGLETRYSILNRDVRLAREYNDQATLDLLRQAGLTHFQDMTLLEFGCGSGGNLLRFLGWGFSPENLVANELLEERVAQARRALPAATRVVPGNFLDMPVETFDIVYQSTVLSSILDPTFRKRVLTHAWGLVRPGGALISYDFTFNNPTNPHVRRVSVAELSAGTPDGEMSTKRVTLAPPLARRVARSASAYRFLNSCPALRTHAVCMIRKPAHS